MRAIFLLALLVAVVAGADLCEDLSVCGSDPGSGKVIISYKQTAAGQFVMIAVSNGYVCACVDTSEAPQPVLVLRGDFDGNGAYGANVLSGPGFSLDAETAQGTFMQPTVAPTLHLDRSNTEMKAVITVSNVTAGAFATEEWVLSVESNSRSVLLETRGQSFMGGNNNNLDVVTSIHHSFCMVPTSIYGLFDRGVVQMKAGPSDKPMYPSHDVLSRVYALGGPEIDLQTRGDVSLSIVRDPVKTNANTSSSVVALVNTDHGKPCWSGVREVLVGGEPKTASLDMWGSDPAVGGRALGESDLEMTTWTTRSLLYPSNVDVPTMGLSTKMKMDAKDVKAMLMGVWPSIVGNLNSHDNEVTQGYHVAQLATTIHHPDTGYSNTYNYFDPDNYFGTTALLFSGDSYLQEQARMVMERTGDFLNEHGQIPHHFVGVEPVFQALSGATQTGPNVFWAMSCLNYAKASGNTAFLARYMPVLRNATRFLYDMIDEQVGLVSAPGPLMIDVFIRANFTSDSNAMLVGFFRELAEGEYAVGNFSGGDSLVKLADSIADSMNRHLWATSAQGNDHYVTQLNPDGTTRDFIDYDSNLIAVAHGIPQRMSGVDPDRTARLLARIDRGRCTHGRATFVSEDYYGPDDTTHGNIGDSWCSMARIGWFDALSRQQQGDVTTFNNVLLEPLKKDLLEWVWLHERYACDGSPQQNRTEMYFEYPALVTMMLRQVRYGIQLGLRSLTIAPFGPSNFTYAIGNVFVEHSADRVSYSVPRSTGALNVTLASLHPNMEYLVQSTGQCSAPHVMWTLPSNADGVLTFEAPAGVDCLVTASATGVEKRHDE